MKNSTINHSPSTVSQQASAAGILLLILVLLALPVDLSGRGRFVSCFFDWLHFPLMTAATFALFSVFCRRLQVTSCWGIWMIGAGLFGSALLMEGLQPLWGRTADVCDIYQAGTGILAAVSFYLASRAQTVFARNRWGAILLLVVLLSLTPMGLVAVDRARARNSFPVLAGFESFAEQGRWELNTCRMQRVKQHATEGSWAVLVKVTDEEDTYPGMFLTDLIGDWRESAALCLDIFWPGEESGTAWIRIDDKDGNPAYADRFQQSLVLTPGANSICIKREVLERTPSGRRLDLGHIRRLGLFLDESAPGEVLYVDHVRLLLGAAE